MKTEIIAIVDASGSMQSVYGDSVGGFAQFLRDQRAVPGEARVSLTTFNSTALTKYKGVPIAEAEGLAAVGYHPSGNTALHDAVGGALDTHGKRIAEEKWADKVIVVILTDGQENASREYTRERVAEMTKHAEANGWSFVFLAANQDAVLASRNIGINPLLHSNVVAQYKGDAIGTRSAYATASAGTATLRSQP